MERIGDFEQDNWTGSVSGVLITSQAKLLQTLEDHAHPHRQFRPPNRFFGFIPRTDEPTSTAPIRTIQHPALERVDHPVFLLPVADMSSNVVAGKGRKLKSLTGLMGCAESESDR